MSGLLDRRTILRGGVGAGLATAAAGAAPAFAKERPAPLGADYGLAPNADVAFLLRNENPYGPSKKALEAIAYAASKGAYYPDTAEDRLIAMIAERNNVPAEAVVLSAGSSEALSAISLAFGKEGAIIAPSLYFDYGARYAERKGARLVRAPVKEDLSVDLAALEAAVDETTALVQLCNPNNPTGEVIPAEALRGFCRRVAKKATVMIDEAYNELTDDPDAMTMMDLVRAGENVVITRTFSKIYGMAGLRMGYTIAPPPLAEKVREHVMSWVSGPALAGAIASYEDADFLRFSKGKILEAREMVVDAVSANGLDYIPSGTNFLYVKLPGDADAFRDRMAKKGVIIRGVYGEHRNWSRVSMGRIEDVARYVKALPEALSA